MTKSPLAPDHFPTLADIKGVSFRAVSAGFKKNGGLDLLLGVFDRETVVAGVYTQSKCPSAPVDWCKKAQAAGQGRIRALVVNAGNANAFTGHKGVASVEETLAQIQADLACAKEEIYVASTGVIGEPIASGTFKHALSSFGIQRIAETLKTSGAQWEAAADAIRTTDTFPKGSGKTLSIDGQVINIAAIAKGSGMIAPNMATMLGFIVTDACISADLLQACLVEAVDISFNSITVDSDTSTSDTVLMCATHQAEGMPQIVDVNDPRLKVFKTALKDILIDLAQQIVKDGEGAQKFIEVTVTGAETNVSARRIALSIANSPLVKTAIAGEDANWGRVVMAVGKAGEAAERDKLSISFGGICVARDGEQVQEYEEAPVAEHLKGQTIQVSVDLGISHGEAKVWTCDLTEGYIRINADYRS